MCFGRHSRFWRAQAIIARVPDGDPCFDSSPLTVNAAIGYWLESGKKKSRYSRMSAPCCGIQAAPIFCPESACMGPCISMHITCPEPVCHAWGHASACTSLHSPIGAQPAAMNASCNLLPRLAKWIDFLTYSLVLADCSGGGCGGACGSDRWWA